MTAPVQQGGAPLTPQRATVVVGSETTPLPTTAKELVALRREAVMRYMQAKYKMPALELFADVAAFFPMPAVTRPREVVDGDGNFWKVQNDSLWVIRLRAPLYELVADITPWLKVPGAMQAIAEVLANPTETVEEVA